MRELVRRAQRIARVITGVLMILISMLLFGYSIELNLNRDEMINVIEDPEPDFFKKLEEKRFEAFKVETNKASNEAGKESEYEDPEPLASLESLEARKRLFKNGRRNGRRFWDWSLKSGNRGSYQSNEGECPAKRTAHKISQTNDH